MDKCKVREQLEVAVRNTHAKYDRFQGVCIYGSFATDKPDPKDVDVITVFDTYNADHDDFIEICKMEEYFKSHFRKLPKDKYIHRRDGRINERIIHIGNGLTYLSDSNHLKEKLTNFGVQPEDFIGTDKPEDIIREVLVGNIGSPAP